jgi:hypothetical protein
VWRARCVVLAHPLLSPCSAPAGVRRGRTHALRKGFSVFKPALASLVVAAASMLFPAGASAQFQTSSGQTAAGTKMLLVGATSSFDMKFQVTYYEARSGGLTTQKVEVRAAGPVNEKLRVIADGVEVGTIYFDETGTAYFSRTDLSKGALSLPPLKPGSIVVIGTAKAVLSKA